jgi:hypothetical protein
MQDPIKGICMTIPSMNVCNFPFRAKQVMKAQVPCIAADDLRMLEWHGITVSPALTCMIGTSSSVLPRSSGHDTEDVIPNYSTEDSKSPTY